MKKFLFLLLIFTLLALSVCAQNTALSPRTANYRISAALNPENKTIDGFLLLNWHNQSPDTIYELQFHLYLNAFKNSASTFMQERYWISKSIQADEWGWIDIETMKINNGADISSAIRFIQPDDNNSHDRTVISVPLDSPVLPDRKVNVEINFLSKLPKAIARSGYAGNYFFVAQWFPKIGVYEFDAADSTKTGQWNCHQYHSASEFYADFGVYEVDITVPNLYVVGATGKRTEEKDNTDGTKTYTYRANDVIDFAWTASQKYKTVNENFNDIAIQLLIQPEHIHQASRYIESVKHALRYFEKHVGKYPYPTLTLVDPPINGMATGGMEYPTLITLNTLWNMPEGFKLPELVTIHEFGHQYFMGIIATNESEEPWLDEGINSYYESRIMDETYNEKSSFLSLWGFHVGDSEYHRTSYTGMDNPKIADNSRKAWEFKHGGYGAITYNKAATWLMTLDRLVGRETMDKIIKTYFERWKFKHPKTEDFIEIVNEVVKKQHGNRFGENMNWFFEQTLYSTEICDYKVHYIRNRKITPAFGVFDKNGGKNTLTREQANQNGNKMYHSKVVIHRLGEVVMPQEILLRFENGREIVEHWDGKSRTFELIYDSPDKIVAAHIDPEQKILLDINLNNNSYTTKPDSTPFWKYFVKIMFWLQNIFQSIAIFA